MSATEVVLVQRRRTVPRALAAALGTGLALDLIGGWGLMLLLPLAGETLGTPDLHPGYWRCFALVALTSLVLGSIRPRRVLPEASR